jgi:hypothetical protein
MVWLYNLQPFLCNSVQKFIVCAFERAVKITIQPKPRLFGTRLRRQDWRTQSRNSNRSKNDSANNHVFDDWWIWPVRCTDSRLNGSIPQWEVWVVFILRLHKTLPIQGSRLHKRDNVQHKRNTNWSKTNRKEHTQPDLAATRRTEQLHAWLGEVPYRQVIDKRCF